MPVHHDSLLKWAWSGALVSVVGLLGYGYYLQFVEYLDPCPLCITQRLFYYGIGIVALIALFGLRRPLWQRLCAALAGLSALGGIVTAGRQVWLQHLPPEQVPECGPGLQYWLENEPWLQTLQLLFKGDGNCAEVHWQFLGLSIAEWSLAWFAGFLVLALAILMRRVAQPRMHDRDTGQGGNSGGSSGASARSAADQAG